MQNRPNVILTVFVLLIGGGLIVYLGLLAKSVWVGLLILVGVVSLLYALGTARVNKGSGYGWGVYIGVLALAGAVYMSRLAGRFWWTPLFLFLSLLFISNGLSMLSENLRAAGTLSVTVSILFFIFSILGPWLLYGSISGVPAAPAAVVRGNFFTGLWTFLLTSIKSGWGILYLAIVILLGRIWFGKWGWLIAPILLILAAGGLAWTKPGGAEPLIEFFSTAPLPLITSALTSSVRLFGSAAWGAILLGVGLVVLLLPAYIVMYSANRTMSEAQKVRQAFGTTIASNLLRGQYTPYTSFVSLITVAASITGFILIWKALTITAAGSGPLEFRLLGVPDLGLPRWKPIWQLPYFLNAGVYALISLILAGIQRRMGLALISVNWFLILFGSFLLSLFVPAGVINFLTGQSLALFIVAPLSLLKKTKMPERPAPERRVDQEELWLEIERRMAQQAAERAVQQAPVIEPVPVRFEEPEITPVMEIEREESPSEPEIEGETLVDHGYTIMKMIADPSGAFLVLDDYGDIYRCHPDGSENEVASFSMDEPIGLASVSGGRLAAVDKTGKLFLTGGAPDTIDTASPIKTFTVNSFGTILAYISPDSSAVRGLILAAAKDQLFIDCNEPLTTITFSSDNRYLAIGTATGKILLFDMANRKIIQTLGTEHQTPVVHLQPTPDGWIAAHENSRVVAWNNLGDLLHSTVASGEVTCMSVDQNSGYLACGNNLGRITILNQQFEEVMNANLHDEDIVSVIFEPSSNRLVTAGIDGAVRRIQY